MKEKASECRLESIDEDDVLEAAFDNIRG